LVSVIYPSRNHSSLPAILSLDEVKCLLFKIQNKNFRKAVSNTTKKIPKNKKLFLGIREWRCRESNPGPNKESESFLHV